MDNTLKHISIRVPWHDNGWNGTICSEPTNNSACLVLSRIREERDDKYENSVKKNKITDLPDKEWPPCVSERATFMAPFEIERSVRHPYAQFGTPEYQHIDYTPLRLPAYSAAAVPFRWMNRKYAYDLAKLHNLDVIPDREPTSPNWVKNSSWMQDQQNHRELLGKFFDSIKPNKSLCFFYAKSSPLSDNEKRVLIGVGFVKSIAEILEYDYTGKGYRSCIWDTPISHSIRPEFRNGFLLPYHKLIELAKNDPSIDLEEYVAFAPDEKREEFSWGSEHVNHGTAIESLLICRNVIEKSRTLVEGDWEAVLKWIEDRISELNDYKGPYPGLGAALSVFGLEEGNSIAQYIFSNIDKNDDPWSEVNRFMDEKSSDLPEIAQSIPRIKKRKWSFIKDKKPIQMELLQFLARMEISNSQASRFYAKTIRENIGIMVEDIDLLKNPYLFYELDRMAVDPIPISTVDLAMFPGEEIVNQFPLPGVSAPEEKSDERRIRAYIINYLELQSSEGHSLYPEKDIILYLNESPVSPQLNVDEDDLEIISDLLSEELMIDFLLDKSKTYQLKRLCKIGELVREQVEGMLKSKRHTINIDWRSLLDEEFKSKANTSDEERAREEKEYVLKELAESPFSVLIGQAGTGKTTLLKILCNHPEINSGGILALAPTGKARVKLWTSIGLPAMTIAQYLRESGRFDGATQRYCMLDSEKEEGWETVIVDEASMLTEEMLGALFDSLKGVKRYILIGDPKQLPPIGTGRPFVDIVNHIRQDNIESIFPRVSNAYGELTVNRRQKGGSREDIEFAHWFSGEQIGPGEDEIFTKILSGDDLNTLRFEEWNDYEELHKLIKQIIVEELGLDNENDIFNFGKSLGAIFAKNNVDYYNRGIAFKLENWQIISPNRGMPHGVWEINRLIQRQFRHHKLKYARSEHNRFNKIIPKPMGPEQIVYGDKVINIRNKNRKYVIPSERMDDQGEVIKPLHYVANGEIGIVVGETSSSKTSYKPNFLRVEYSSQPEFEYSYGSWELGEDEAPVLQLAYAITVHKSQGSEFNLTILVLPIPNRIISRELLYTALTRQVDRVVVLHQGPRSAIKRYSSTKYSDTANRLTNLFQMSDPVIIEKKFLDQNLIHRTKSGTFMRSKSEVIIAHMLEDENILYAYEMELKGSDNKIKFPDFTIMSKDKKVTYYWEHLGMLGDDEYRKKWERKKIWYEEQGIIPSENGGGENGVLITTSEIDGRFDAVKIRKIIDEVIKK